MEAAGVREGKGRERAEWSWPCSWSLRPPHPSSNPLVRTGPGAPNWAFQAAPWIHRVSSPRTPAAPFLWFWGGPAPFPQPPLHTHCLRAGAHAPPETGSRGASGPPLLTHDSWIRTEKQRVGDCRDPSGQCYSHAKLYDQEGKGQSLT